MSVDYCGDYRINENRVNTSWCFPGGTVVHGTSVLFNVFSELDWEGGVLPTFLYADRMSFEQSVLTWGVHREWMQ